MPLLKPILPYFLQSPLSLHRLPSSPFPVPAPSLPISSSSFSFPQLPFTLPSFLLPSSHIHSLPCSFPSPFTLYPSLLSWFSFHFQHIPYPFPILTPTPTLFFSLHSSPLLCSLLLTLLVLSHTLNTTMPIPISPQTLFPLPHHLYSVLFSFHTTLFNSAALTSFPSLPVLLCASSILFRDLLFYPFCISLHLLFDLQLQSLAISYPFPSPPPNPFIFSPYTLSFLFSPSLCPPLSYYFFLTLLFLTLLFLPLPSITLPFLSSPCSFTFSSLSFLSPFIPLPPLIN